MSTRLSPPPANAAKAAQRAAEVRLTARDIRLLVDLYEWAAMLRSHLEALYFSSPQRARARLAALWTAGYVSRGTYPIAPSVTLAQTGEYVYTLGRAGIAVVAGQVGVDAAAIRQQQRHGTPQHLAHTLEAVSFRLAVLSALQNQDGPTLESFISERQSRHAYEARPQGGEGPWRMEVFKPDALLILSDGRVRRGYGIEIDLGNTSAEEFKLKTKIHAHYAALGLSARRYDLPALTTLTVTTSEARLSHLVALVAPEQAANFLFTTYARLREEGFLGPIWTRPGQKGVESLCAADRNASTGTILADRIPTGVGIPALHTKERL